ncbi:MAG: RluA family pseudouridine synthase [Nannocystales bacterium]
MGSWPAFELTSAAVRHDAGGLLVVSKPAGLAVHATVDPARPHLAGAVLSWVKARGGADAALHHRLDVDTSGLVLFATDAALNRAISEMFSNHTVDKHYRAVVQPSGQAPPDTWKVENFLGRDKESKATRYRAVRSGGKKAITNFEVLERRTDGTILVEARPVTGRAHQIRVHCAEAGWPIVGDRFYGGDKSPRLMLHAQRLCFEHPRGGRVDVQDLGDSGFSTARRSE